MGPALVRMASVAGSAEMMSVPASRGAAVTHHNAKCDLCSAIDRPTFPT